MSSVISFIPNTSYSADDLNGITGDFAVAGTSFADGITYGVDDLNAIRQDMVTKGVYRGVGNACAVSIASGQIKVTDGKAFFTAGVRIVIDSGGLSLAYTAGTAGYVWLEYSPSLSIVLLRFTTTAPSGDYVKLATVSAAGAVTDAREYCSVKIPPACKTLSVTLGSGAAAGDLVASVPANDAGYSYATIYLYNYLLSNSTSIWRLSDNYLLLGLCIYTSGGYYAVNSPGSTYSTLAKSGNSVYAEIRCAYEGGYLKFYRGAYYNSGIQVSVILS